MNSTSKYGLVAATCLLATFGRFASAQDATPPGVPVGMIVTAEPKKGKEAPKLQSGDIAVYEKKNNRPVQSMLPLSGDHAGMQLLLLIDDRVSYSFNTQINDLKKFVSGLPGTTQIAVAYMRNGTVQLAQNFTADHEAAAKTIRVAMSVSSINASPYLSLTDVVKRWPQNELRHQVIMISDGLQLIGGNYPSNPYLDTAIETCQKAGVIVYTIYSPGSGHYGRSFWRSNWGQNSLSQLSDETGGESYFLGLGAPVSFVPYLEEITQRQGNQYLVTFLAEPEKKAGWQSVQFKTERENTELSHADRVYVRAGY